MTFNALAAFVRASWSGASKVVIWLRHYIKAFLGICRVSEDRLAIKAAIAKPAMAYNRWNQGVLFGLSILLVGRRVF